MVKKQKKNNAKTRINQGKSGSPEKASKIGPSTSYGYCSERLSSFGGLLGLVKFMDLINFKEVFEVFYKPPSRDPAFGHYNMMCGLIMLLFIGFNRVWHFIYIRFDSMLCSIFNVVKLPYVTTYWRYVDSLGINQGKSLLLVMSALRERVWHLCEISYETIHIDIDTTVNTIFGNQQGGRKGHNTKNRGKKGYRSVLCFIEETREYFTGKLRVGETMGGKEVAALIYTFNKYLPGCVRRVILRGDGEFISWESVEAAKKEGFEYIFGNKACNPPFDGKKWYKVRKKDEIEYNECIYQPMNWGEACRFVVMRIPKKVKREGKVKQHMLFEEREYEYRIFVTNMTGKPHKVIMEYDKRADCENLIGEAKREGLSAVPTGKFSHNYAYFQIVMLSYNIWRSFKMLAGHSRFEKEEECGEDKAESKGTEKREIVDNTIRISRLKLLLISSKITGHSGSDEVKYSQHDSRVSGLFRFFEYLDKRRKQLRPWLNVNKWRSKHMLALGFT